MIDILYLGSVPCEEACAQLGADDYSARSRVECRAYIAQLYRVLDAAGHTKEKLPELFRIRTKSEHHDFGTYIEVVCAYDTDDEEGDKLACWLSDNLPENWDEQARADILGENL